MMKDKSTTERRGGIIGRAVADSRAQTSETPQQITPERRADLFASVKQARERAKVLDVAGIMTAAGQVSENTGRQYSRIIKRRMSGGVVDLAGLSRASWYPTIAALKAGLSGRIQSAMKAQDKAQRAGDFELVAKLVKRAEQALDQLEAIKAASPPVKEKVQRSARQRLPKTAKDGPWQAKVHEAATETMRPAIAVMWATGARPAELELGVDVERVARGLRVRIPGAKVNDNKGSGQPVRVLLIDENTPAGRALAAALGDASKVHIQRRAGRIGKDFSDRIRPRLPASYRVSAYSFRHQAAANMKADLNDAEAVATAMGHRTTRSQQNYGTARQSQAGGGAVLDARATYQPKETRGLVLHSPQKPSSSPSLS